MIEPNPGKISPEVSREIIKDYLNRQFLRGLTPDGCLGYHGCSIETLTHVIQHGVLPGYRSNRQVKEGYDIKPGDLYYWPVGMGNRRGDSDRESAGSYANRLAKAHYFLSSLGLSIQDDENMTIASDLTFWTANEEAHVKRLAEKGIPHDRVAFAIRESQYKTGFVIGFSTDVVNTYSIEDCEEHGDDGSRIRTGSGLPYSYIHGIQPLGDSAGDSHAVGFLVQKDK